MFWLSYISQLPPFFKQESQSEVSLSAQSLVLWVSGGQCSACVITTGICQITAMCQAGIYAYIYTHIIYILFNPHINLMTQYDQLHLINTETEAQRLNKQPQVTQMQFKLKPSRVWITPPFTNIRLLAFYQDYKISFKIFGK